MLDRFLSRAFVRGSLEIVDAGGKTHPYGDGSGDLVRIRFTSAEAERAVFLDPEMKLGEGYVDGGYVVELGSLYGLLELLFTNVNGVMPPWPTAVTTALRYMTRRFRQFNPPGRARRNVHAHYDLDGRLYALFLDDDLQYSCAYFEDGVTSLDAAQRAKKRHLASKLALRPGQRVLDIGSGWGGLGLYLAEHADVDVVGATLSDEQLATSNRQAEERGLAGRVRFLLQDYRQVRGPFDRIVSVGMFEHVGINHYRTFFDVCRDLLSDDGVMVLHSIGRFGGPSNTSAWIQRYIFPGGYIPALSEVIPRIERSGLKLTDIEILRLHYAKTLRLWRERFLARREEAAALYDERFCRTWEYYLAVSEVAFRVGNLMNFQIQIAKNQETLPLTRGYMAASEAALGATEREASDRRPLKLAGE